MKEYDSGDEGAGPRTPVANDFDDMVAQLLHGGDGGDGAGAAAAGNDGDSSGSGAGAGAEEDARGGSVPVRGKSTAAIGAAPTTAHGDAAAGGPPGPTAAAPAVQSGAARAGGGSAGGGGGAGAAASGVCLLVEEARSAQDAFLAGGRRKMFSPLNVKRAFHPQGRLRTRTQRLRHSSQSAAHAPAGAGVVRLERLEELSKHIERYVTSGRGPGLPTCVCVHSKFIAIGMYRSVVVVFDHFQVRAWCMMCVCVPGRACVRGVVLCVYACEGVCVCGGGGDPRRGVNPRHAHRRCARR